MVNLMDALKQSLKGKGSAKRRAPFAGAPDDASSREESPSLARAGAQGGVRLYSIFRNSEAFSPIPASGARSAHLRILTARRVRVFPGKSLP